VRAAAWWVALALVATAASGAAAQEPFGRPQPLRPTDEEAGARDEEAEPLGPAGDRRPVVIASLEGDLSTGARARRFVAALQEVFDEDEFRAERAKDRSGAWKSAGSARNRFRLLDGDEPGDDGDAWLVTLVADSLHDPPAGSSGVRVLVAILSPQAARMNARPQPVREDLLLDPAAMKRDYAGAAGRVAGLRVLERLHHLDGQLDERTRLAWPGRAMVKRPPVE
jgi:hypothetical protein